MKQDLRQYAQIGLVHHLLYPRCVSDPDYHVRTLEHFVRTFEFDTYECCVPYFHEGRERLIELLRSAGRRPIYAAHLFPLRKISLGSTCPQEQAITRLAMANQIEAAVAIGVEGIVFTSGADAPDGRRAEAQDAFRDFCRWFCGELRLHGMTAMLEPFDRTKDKRFLYGPTGECVALIESLAGEVDNLAIELDIAHLPLMGESFREAIDTTAPHLRRVHLGNCVLKDPADPRYGDTHPPIGYPGGEIDVPQLVEALRRLLEVGYLAEGRAGDVVLEVQPLAGRSPEETVADSLRKLHEAWGLV